MNHITLIPAIVPQDVERTVQLLQVVRGFSHTVQIDIGDGEFTKHATVDINKIPKSAHETLQVEAHLMVRDIESEIAKWIPRRPKRVILHAESKPSAQIIQTLQHEGIEVGIGLNADSDNALLDPYMHLVSSVLFLCITPPGEQGRPFIHRVLHKIKSFRARFLAITIEADGGIDEETMEPLIKTGVTRFVIGSAIFSTERHPAEAYTYLRQLALDIVQ
jgi:ribulose-phosphate 3-epimerase